MDQGTQGTSQPTFVKQEEQPAGSTARNVSMGPASSSVKPTDVFAQTPSSDEEELIGPRFKAMIEYLKLKHPELVQQRYEDFLKSETKVEVNAVQPDNMVHL